ncbi:Glyoxalase/Bleomycin resistance protein/Dioxygenase superfamily protein [Variovorax sp. PDC80]|uniref:VOC family protein n=1 Tax=Variovorax sp. PDC80 TaxID=1882827 RepID=UPI0008E71BCC|nr:VOC family protein [Variovorax sp. PDC80]SFN99248.1 Glyoxalase/Bleomycin resistance protein/Dioxygenase superfamily protein [Variovorax sp. PDC80]
MTNHEHRPSISPDPVSPSRLAHIVFRTRQLKVLVDWYCTVLGAHVVFASERIAFLTYDEEHHRIALIGSDELADRPPSPAVGFFHVAFTYEGLPQLLQNYVRLKAAGILPHRTIVHGPTVSMYYSDPDGNEVELQIDVFPTADESTAWMQGEAFTNNPIGILFDAEEMLSRYEAGEPISSLTRRADA